MFHGLLHPSDFRRLLVQATALGVVAFTPLIAESGMVPDLGPDGGVAGAEDWPQVIRDAAESHGRGRLPSVGPTSLLDPAIDEACMSGRALMIASPGDTLGNALADRPFSVHLFCAPPGGFTIDEQARAESHGAILVAPVATHEDPIQSALAAIRETYAILEA